MKETNEGWTNNTRALALHAADQGLIPDILKPSRSES